MPHDDDKDKTQSTAVSTVVAVLWIATIIFAIGCGWWRKGSMSFNTSRGWMLFWAVVAPPLFWIWFIARSLMDSEWGYCKSDLPPGQKLQMAQLAGLVRYGVDVNRITTARRSV